MFLFVWRLLMAACPAWLGFPIPAEWAGIAAIHITYEIKKMGRKPRFF